MQINEFLASDGVIDLIYAYEKNLFYGHICICMSCMYTRKHLITLVDNGF